MPYPCEDPVEVAAGLLWEGAARLPETVYKAEEGPACPAERRFLICRRPMQGARGGLYEFPGGKRESGESLLEALKRECLEELGVCVEVGARFGETLYRYPDITVRLTLFHCRIARGIPRSLEHSELHWILPEEIPRYKFCPADEDFLSAIYRNTPAPDRQTGTCGFGFRE